MEQAIIYCRVSDPRQVTDGSSLVVQEKQGREYVRIKGYALKEVFVEEGESAKTDDRTVLKRMLIYCQEHHKEIDVVIIPKIDRLARMSYDYGSIRLFLRRLNIRVESVGEHIEDTPVGRFMENVLSSVAQLDNEIRAERSLNGMVEAVENGRWCWMPPYGYRFQGVSKEKNLAPKEPEAGIVREAFEQVGSGSATINEVLHRIRRKGYKHATSHFYSLLSNPVYTGIIVAFGGEHRGTYEPLVSKELFDRVQYRLSRKKSRKREYLVVNDDFPLKGTLVCECGTTYRGSWSKQHRYAYYRCHNCSMVNHKKQEVEERFVDGLNGYSVHPSDWERLDTALKRNWRERTKYAVDERKRVTAEIEEAKRIQENLAIKNASGIIPDELAASQIKLLNEKIIGLTLSLSQIEEVEDFINVHDFARQALLRPGDFWNESTGEVRRKLQSFFFPDGTILDKDCNYATLEISLLSYIKRQFVTVSSSLVPQSVESCNFLAKNLMQLTAIVEP